MNNSEADKMAKEKSNKGTELISPEKIKKEPEEVTPVSASKSTSVSKTITVLTTPTGCTKASNAQPKTILLVQTVNSRTGGIQSLLLPQGLRSLPTTTSDMTFSASRAKMSTLLTVTSSAGKSPLSVVPKMTENLMTSATGVTAKASIPQVVQSQIQAQNDIKSIVKLSSAAVPSTLPRVCELTFNSRTIKADGTVCTLKEYLCNFCQYKVASQSEFREHFMTHVFCCNYCSFRALTRYEVLSHKKEKHQGIAEELAGYEGLDGFSEQMNSLMADFHCQLPVVSTQMLVVSTPVSSTGESTTTTDSESASMVIVSSRPSATTSSSVPSVRAFSTASPITGPSCLLSSPASGVSVNRSVTLSAPVSQTSQPVVTTLLSTPVVSAAFMAQKKTPVVTSATPSPVILPVSTVKTTASVGKANDNYFTYKIVHDAAGKVQAYECDVCSYRSTKINEIFGHASTHSLTDLMKSNNVNVQWECFYCCFTSVLQANVVSHVIAKHPNKPIQLKRMVTNTAQRSTSRSVLLRSTNFPTDAGSLAKATPSPPIKKEKNSDETPTSAASAAKKPDEADDGCMWGCYYCSVQSVDRNEIILHLKKDHAQQKLVITRRRITHVPAPPAAKTDGKPEATEIGSDSLPNESELVLSEQTNSDVQIGDIDSTDPQHSLLKSRRKQIFPRKVFEDAANDEAGEPSNKTTEVAETAVVGTKGKRRFPYPAKSKEFPEQTDLRQVDGTAGKRQQKSEESAKRMKRGDSMGKDVVKMLNLTFEGNGAEDDASTATIVIDGQDGTEDAGMPALEDVSNFIKLKPAHGKVSSPQVLLANDPMEQVAVTSCSVNEATLEPDKEMPVLHPELTVPGQVDGNFNNKQGPVNGSKEKDNVVLEDMNLASDWPDDISLNDSKLFHFNSATMEACCNSCHLTLTGLNARNHMREHVMTHTGGHLWTCPYCPFKCGRHSVIVRHVQNKHKNRPLRLIQRKVYNKSSENGTAAGFHAGSTDHSKTEQSSVISQERPEEHSGPTKLKGPRTVKERSMIRTSTHMWQCPFCGRRNVFKGALRIHLKVSHPNEDCKTELKKLTRPAENLRKKPVCKEGVINIVPIEEMHLYETLSTLLLDNGMSLIHDLDIDDLFDDVEDPAAANQNTGTQKYRCMHCNFRNFNLKAVKNHVLQVHPGELVIILDHRTSRRPHHLFMCRYPECLFHSNRQELLTGHSCKGMVQEIEKAKLPSDADGKLQSGVELQPSSDLLARLRTQSKSQANTDSDSSLLLPTCMSEVPKLVDASGSEVRQEAANTAGNIRKRLKTPEGPIDYNDDGTLKGVELEHGSMVLQCRYCDYPKTSDPVEIKDHLASKHPRLKPIAIDVDAKDKGGLACLFVCSVFGCDYSSHYSNVFEHHMNLEHPDVESNRLVKKKRTHKRTSSEKPRFQNDLSNLWDKNEQGLCKQGVLEETSAARASSKSSDDNKDPLRTVTLASPATSTFSQPALSPVGTVTSDVSTAFGDSPALGSPDELIPAAEVPMKETRLLKKPRTKTRESFDYPVRFECVQCSFRIGSLEEMKSHLVAKHRDNFRNFYCIDRRARELRKRQKVLFCHDEHCSFYCKFEEELESHEKYSCTFAEGVRHHQKTTQEGVLQYMESVVKVNPGGVTSDGEKLYQVSSSRGAMVEDVNNKMYQCSHCTFITTDLHNIRMHVIAEHAATEGGFAEIKTELGTDGNIVMNVNDRGLRELGSKSTLNVNLGCEKNVIRESRSMYDAVDTVKIDDEEKVYTVL